MKKNIHTSSVRQQTQNIHFILPLLAFLLTLIAAPSVCQAATDMTDESFGTRGEVTTLITYRADRATAVVVQPDGKIVIGGNSGGTNATAGGGYNFTLVRYNSDGNLDNSFGIGGKVNTSLDSYGYPNFSITTYGLIRQTDGKIVLSGKLFNGSIVLIRYNNNGTIDNSFGVNGIVFTQYDDLGSMYQLNIAVQSNDKIIVAGSGGTSGRNTFFAIRYNTDGSLDQTFGLLGRVLIADLYTLAATSIVIQPDSKIVIATGSRVIRFNPDGTLDSAFGSNGIAPRAFENRYSEQNSLAIQPDGKIVVGGKTHNGVNNNPIYYPSLARYNTDGSFDTSFGTNGEVIRVGESSSLLQSIALQSDGKIITTGYSTRGAETFRFNVDGTIDRSFGIYGKASSKSSYNAKAVAIQADGKIVTAGDVMGSGNSDLDFMVARYVSGPGRSLASYDFDGDGKSDIGLFRPSEGAWYLNQSSAGSSGAAFGAAGDKPVAADYDGDGKADLAVYRGGTWYLLRSQAGFTAIQFGNADDIPMPADYNDDDKADLAVYRPSNGYWYQFNLVNNQFTADLIGQNGGQPVILRLYGGYGGYFKTQFGVFNNGHWHITWKSISGNQNLNDFTYGTAGDIPVSADYNGDGYTEAALFRPSNGTWYFLANAPYPSGYSQISFGMAGDVPVPADYDGDGKADVAVFRNGTWYINRTLDGLTGVNFGAATDIPVPGAYIP